MRHRRRRIQYYNAEPTRERLRDKPWVPFALIAIVALVIALIVGAILGSIARRTDRNGITYGDLADFGGVDTPEKTYENLYAVHADFVASDGMGQKDFKNAVRDLPDGNAVGVWLYDGRGGVWFDTSLANKTAEKLTVRASLTADELAETAQNEKRYGVGYFVTGAFAENDEQLRLLTVAHEMALLSELASSGLREVVLVGLPANAEWAIEVSRYVRQADEVLGGVILGVAVPAESDAAARLVGVTESYADSYFLDARALSGDALGKAVTENAYYLTAYRMRIMLNEADRESALALAEGFDLYAYQLMPKDNP